MRSLLAWSWLVVALLAAHDVTHVVDDGLETSLGQLALVAVPQWLVVGALMVLVVRGDDRAAIVLGAGVTAGFVLVHLLPVVPTSFWELEPSAVSWALAWTTTAAGLVMVALARPGRNSGVVARADA